MQKRLNETQGPFMLSLKTRDKPAHAPAHTPSAVKTLYNRHLGVVFTGCPSLTVTLGLTLFSPAIALKDTKQRCAIKCHLILITISASHLITECIQILLTFILMHISPKICVSVYAAHMSLTLYSLPSL